MKRAHQFRNGTNYEKAFSWLVFLLFFLASSLNGLLPVFRGDFHYINYKFWVVSEWLINYQGGFVRRGLSGQVLWLFEQWTTFDVRVVLTCICLISSAAMLWVIWRMFKKEGWALLIIPTGFCLGYTLFSLFGRRDYISLLLTLSIFVTFRHVILHPGKWLGWVLFHGLSALQLLMHEAAFFYTFPILMLYSYCRSRNDSLPVLKSAGRVLLQFLPALAVMTAVCLFKGNERVAHAIWDSWMPIISTYQSDLQLGYGLVALTWDPWVAFEGHFTTAFVGDVSPAAWRIVLVLFNFMAAYYLTTRLNCVHMGPHQSRPMNHVLMSDVMLVQFVALLPMFTILSCDWGRTLPYWAISSMFFYHTFKHERVHFLPALSRLSSRLQGGITGSRVLSSPLTYTLIVLLAPVPTFKAPLDQINTFQQKFLLIIQDIFNQLATFIA